MPLIQRSQILRDADLISLDRPPDTTEHLLPEDDDRSAFLDVLRTYAVSDFISSISTENKQRASKHGRRKASKIPGINKETELWFRSYGHSPLYYVKGSRICRDWWWQGRCWRARTVSKEGTCPAWNSRFESLHPHSFPNPPGVIPEHRGKISAEPWQVHKKPSIYIFIYFGDSRLGIFSFLSQPFSLHRKLRPDTDSAESSERNKNKFSKIIMSTWKEKKLAKTLFVKDPNFWRLAVFGILYLFIYLILGATRGGHQQLVLALR